MSSPIITPQIKAPVINFPAPSAADLDAVAAEQKAREATAGNPVKMNLAEPPTSFGVATKADLTGPSLDTTKFDSLGNEKTDAATFGPRGANAPLDVMTEGDKAKVADAQEKKLQAGMSSTVHVDSVGNPKGEFHVTCEGHDKHGARIPDKVNYSKPIEAQPMVGPRGKGAQPDTYHGAKPTGR